MLAFAASAATAVATAQTVGAERLRGSLRASEQERRRWARELHDETLQGLGGLHVLLASALRRSVADPAALAGAVRQAVDQAVTEIENLRTLITELRPAALDALGLGPALNSLVERVTTVEGLIIEFECDLGTSVDRLSEDLETAIYRLVQEALSNVAKHARAERVEITIVRGPADIAVTIRDDGQGFDSDGLHTGFGLLGMRERAELAGGRVEVSSGSGRTTVAARLPVRE